MNELNFPEISKEIQQSVYGAWGGSNSQNQDVDYYIPLDEVVVGGGGGSSSSGGSGGGFYWGGSGGNGDDGGYDYYQGAGGGGEYGDNSISADSLINVAEGDATEEEFYDVDSKIRAAVNATGLAAGFTGTAMDGIKAITEEIGFTATKFGAIGTKIGYAGVIIGGVEVVIAASEAVTGENPWDSADTLNLLSTGLGVAAVVFPGTAIVLGGLSIAVGLVGTAYSNSSN